MTYESLMENIYFGKADLSEIDYNEATEDDIKVAEIFEKYREAVKDFPPGLIESEGHAPPALLEKLRTTGFFGLYIPSEYGGIGLTLHQYLLMVKQIVKLDMALGILALAHLSIGMKAILLFGNESQKKKYLTKAASGEMIFGYALTEPLFGSDAKDIDTIVELSSDKTHYILNGTKTFITNANYAGGLTVFAQMDRTKKGTLGAFIVETSWEGVRTGKDMPKMGLSASSTASFQFNNVRIPLENIIGMEGDGFRIAMTVLNYGRLALGAASSGMLEVSFNDMLKRSSGRVQFGKPIFEFELIQQKIVRAFVDTQVIWAMTNLTAGMLEKNPVAHVAIESSHCKLYGTDRAWDTLYNAMQTAGGAGYLKTQPYEKRMRDFRVATIFEGTSEIHSVYPPLSAFRNMAKNLRIYKKSSLSRFLFLVHLYYKSSKIISTSSNNLISDSLAAVKSYAQFYRKLFVRAFKIFRNNIADQELLLKRLTTISVQIYALVSMMRKIDWLQKENRDQTGSASALQFLLAESEEIVRNNKYFEPVKKDIQQKVIVQFIRDTVKNL
jgi:acyl-CoA dehydrogenase family member 9